MEDNKKSAVKQFKESVMWSVLSYALLLVGVLIGVNVSFYLMNLASTLAFIVGVLLLIFVIGFPLEFVVIRHIKEIKKKNQNNNQ